MPDPKPPPGEQWSYCDRRYWDTRYQRALGSSAAPAARSASSSGEEDSAVFDWLCDATSLAALARRSWAGRDPVVLDMGCGNSELPEALARGDRSDVGGWQRAGFVLGSDYSSSGVLQLMASRAAAGGLGGYIDYMIDDIRLSMRWQRHTSRDAGPLLEEATANANSVVREVSRVLAPGGVFIVVSYEPPAGRRSVLEADDATWHLEVAGEEDEMGNYIYVCRKVGLELGTLDATLMGEEGSLIEVD
eukprot:jgi/Tetstr1/435779/TSEL_024670.t1